MPKKNEVTLNHGARMDDNWTVGTAACGGIEYKFNVKHTTSRANTASGADGAASSGLPRRAATSGKGETVAAVFVALIAMFN